MKGRSDEGVSIHWKLMEIIMEHTKELLSINVSNLVASPYNVRRHSVGQVEELAALIASQGLLHNLIVTEQTVEIGRAHV